MIQSLDKEIGYHTTSGRAKRELPIKDIRRLMKCYVDEDLLEQCQARTHSPSLLHVASNTTAGINGKSLCEWMEGRIGMCKIRHYYRQFITASASFSSESEDAYPLLLPTWWDTTL